MVAACALSGCSVLEGIFPAQAQRDEETQKIEESGQQDVFQVALGDCFNNEADPNATEVTDLPAVPCDQPHDNEIYFLFDLTGEEFPADAETQADTGCFDQFETFAGIPFETSTLSYSAIWPTADTWSQGDREVICFIFDPAAQTTGSLAGAAR
jgi:hypothetical protein